MTAKDIISTARQLTFSSNPIVAKEESSVITVVCRPEDYCASLLSHAVEDTDAHLLALLTSPADDGRVKVTLTINHSDPSSAIRSLERYDFEVVDAHGSTPPDPTVSMERLLSLQTLLNV